MLLTILISTAALTAAQPTPVAVADATARLSQPREQRQMLDGRSWGCDASGDCAGRGPGTSQPAMRECRRFVARFGPVTAFARGGIALTADELARCNAAAR